MAKKTYFITGTDTGVGKTYIACALLKAFAKAGKTTMALKPIAAGCEESEQGLCNDDALALQQAATVKLDYALINPFALKAATAPHIAAALEGRRLTLDRVAGMCRGTLMTKADICLIEGAGGWRVPLNDRESLSQLPAALQTPVILVVAVRLGCLNHALLTAEAIIRDGLPLAGWVANCMEPDMPNLQANIETLKTLIPAPCLGVVGFAEDQVDVTDLLCE
ncbi:MAG: dethiobiotin synthase [Marinagarivorans sp.]|nr:dethiobiotin synthase [Marinagarivorans sp.]